MIKVNKIEFAGDWIHKGNWISLALENVIKNFSSVEIERIESTLNFKEPIKIEIYECFDIDLINQINIKRSEQLRDVFEIYIYN